MDDKLSVVTSALESIKKHGFCAISNFRKEEIKIVTSVLKQCERKYSIYEQEHSVQIFARKGQKFG